MYDLIKVANELQKVMDFEEGGPPVEGTEKALKKWVEEAVEEIDYEIDKFTDDTTRILIDMQLWRGPALDEDEDEDDPEVEVVEEVEEVDNLVDQIKAAGQMKDLKNTCKDLDEFKSIRGQLSKYKSIKELREVMLEMLAAEKEDKQKPKAVLEKHIVEKKEKKESEELKVSTAKKEVEKKVVPKKVSTEKKKADTRIYAMAIVLKENPKLDIAEATTKSDALYVKLTGQVSNLREQRAQYIRVTRVMEALELL